LPPTALEDIARLVDAAATSRVLVFGGLPPDARDLDLLLHTEDHGAAAGRLAEAGLERHGDSWASFADCAATAADLVPAAEWQLPAAEEEALFAHAVPLDGYEQLSRPAPHHVLLLLARRLAHGRGTLDERRRERVKQAVAEDPDAWWRAREHASGWGAQQALDLLRRVSGGGPDATRRERAAALDEELRAAGVSLARLRAWRAAAPGGGGGAVVAFSGLDGAGKSTQAESLKATLAALGHEAVVIWSPLGQSRTLSAVANPVKGLLSHLRFGPLKGIAERSASGSVMAAREDDGDGGGAGGAVRIAWSTVVALVNALSLRAAGVRHLPRGRVVIFDRHVLDSIVRLRATYGASRRFPTQLALLRLVAPRPTRAYLLDLDPDASVRRKDDRWSLDQLRLHARLYREESERFDVRVLDAERPRDELCAEIARDVWRALP
jgi:thymidylate kinase